MKSNLLYGRPYDLGDPWYYDNIDVWMPVARNEVTFFQIEFDEFLSMFN